MTRKLTYEEVKRLFEDVGYILVDTEYVNVDTKLRFICPQHPDKYTEISVSKLKQGRRCKYCSKAGRRDIEYAREEFAKKGYELLETEYKGVMKPMRYRCPAHPDKELYISLNNLKRHGCPYCANRAKPTYEEVKKEFESRGYELLETEYVNNRTKMKYRCLKHPNTVQEITYTNFKKSGCRFCGRERTLQAIVGENNHNWKGGLTELNFFLRQSINEWKRMSLNNTDYTCFVTEEWSDKLHVHHTRPYHEVRDEVLHELGLPLYKTIGEYTKEQLDLIQSLFLKKHMEIEGVPIREDVHKLFHKLYGDDATTKDLIEFKYRYQQGEFDELLGGRVMNPCHHIYKEGEHEEGNNQYNTCAV